MNMCRSVILLFSLLRIGNIVLSNEIVICPEGQYMPLGSAQCVNCSLCPDNEIVHETCLQNRDTICGKFTEFRTFHRENDGNVFDNVMKDFHSENVVTHQEADDNVTSSWQTASFIMIILLSITTVICAILIGTVCYRCKRDKKDGLMIYVEKDSIESPIPGCSAAASQHSVNVDDINHGVKKNSPSASYDSDKNGIKQSNTPVHNFEIAEDRPNT